MQSQYCEVNLHEQRHVDVLVYGHFLESDCMEALLCTVVGLEFFVH